MSSWLDALGRRGGERGAEPGRRGGVGGDSGDGGGRKLSVRSWDESATQRRKRRENTHNLEGTKADKVCARIRAPRSRCSTKLCLTLPSPPSHPAATPQTEGLCERKVRMFEGRALCVGRRNSGKTKHRELSRFSIFFQKQEKKERNTQKKLSTTF